MTLSQCRVAAAPLDKKSAAPGSSKDTLLHLSLLLALVYGHSSLGPPLYRNSRVQQAPQTALGLEF